MFYDSTRPIPQSKFRPDINVIGMPLTEIVNAAYTDSRQRQLFKNIIYVGALSALLDIDPKAIEERIAEQFKGKDKLIQPNYPRAAHGPRLRAEASEMPARHQGRARRRGRRQDLHRRQ